MNKLILILSILPFAICTGLSDYQTFPEYGAPTGDYQNNEMKYSQPEQNNNFNQNYDLFPVLNQLPIQQLPIEEHNQQYNNFENTNRNIYKNDHQNSQYNPQNIQNFIQNQLVVEKSKEIPLDFLSNPVEKAEKSHKTEATFKTESNFLEMQNLIKELLWKNYVDTIQDPTIKMHIENEQKNLNIPQVFEPNQNSITAQSKKPGSPVSSEPLLNFETPTTQSQTENYNPNSYEYKNQNFQQINPHRTYFNQFVMKPTPNSKYEIPISNTNTLDKSYSAAIPLNQHSNNYNNRIYQQNPKTKSKITTQIYAYGAPDETEEETKTEELLKEISQRQHYKVIFIKAPNQISQNALKLVQAQAQKDDKTVIYVLSKKFNPAEIQETLESVKTNENKPEVHFIKYKTEEESLLAQQNIKAQYDNIDENGEVSNSGLSTIVTSPGNYHSNEILQKQIDENRSYLPAF